MEKNHRNFAQAVSYPPPPLPMRLVIQLRRAQSNVQEYQKRKYGPVYRGIRDSHQDVKDQEQITRERFNWGGLVGGGSGGGAVAVRGASYSSREEANLDPEARSRRRSSSSAAAPSQAGTGRRAGASSRGFEPAGVRDKDMHNELSSFFNLNR